jgi:hypothetical protein
MVAYFGSAYCTIAATSVTDPQVDEGFLERRSYKMDQDPECFIEFAPRFRRDNFHRDLEGGDIRCETLTKLRK